MARLQLLFVAALLVPPRARPRPPLTRPAGHRGRGARRSR
jgi:hypothetical protein